MARPLSWLPRLHEIRQSVANSVRSHYSRAELEALFQIQPRAASRMLEILPTNLVGTSKLIARETLAAFLDRVKDAEDVPALMDAIRAEKATVSRRRLRHLVQREYDPMTVFGIPETLRLKRGHLEIDFETMESLSETLVSLAKILEDDLDEFVRLYEPAKLVEKDESAAEVAALFAELEEKKTAKV
jgi:hypothetical protein